MKTTLRDKNIMVTGASRGIGRAIAQAVARAGANVGINYMNSREEALKLAGDIESEGLPPPFVVQFNAASPEEIERAVESFLAEFETMDGLVNNAAINISGLLPVLSDKEISQQLDSALLGPILCCRAAIPPMLGNGKGSIVNIGSAVTGRAFRGQSVYAAAKGGLLSFSRSLAFEYARKGIRVNCVQPGPVDTEMLEASRQLAGSEILKHIPAGRYISPEEIASLVVFLLSDSSASITGECINVDGGMTL